MIETAVAKFGRLDVLVNNAGTSYRNKVRPTFSFILCYVTFLFG